MLAPINPIGKEEKGPSKLQNFLKYGAMATNSALNIAGALQSPKEQSLPVASMPTFGFLKK